MNTQDRKNKILGLLNEPSYTPMKEKELAVMMQVSPADRPLFKQCLEELLQDGMICMSRRGRYHVPDVQALKGTFFATGHGYGFVSVEGIDGDFYISEKNTGTALHGDTVLIEPLDMHRRRGKSREAVVAAVTERATYTVVGTYDAREHYGFVISVHGRMDRDIFIPAQDSMGAKDGHRVVVRITDYGDERRNPQGQVTEILGYADAPGMDVLSILRNYGIDMDFPADVEAAAKAAAKNVCEEDLSGREDIRSLDMVTIDGPDSKDFDDAVSLTMDGDTYELGVHIADVAHYVTEGSCIDREALRRGTSCYPPGMVSPMLPFSLSNGICSLNGQTDRLALSVFMTVSPEGEITGHRFSETVIRTNHRMIYSDVERMITYNDEKLCEKYSDVSDMLKKMDELAGLLRKRRKEKGSIDFDIPETEIVLDDALRPTDVHPHERNSATRLIEDFMIAANETVAEHFYWAQIPFVYRIHEKPDADKIEKLTTFIRNFGYGLKVRGDGIHPMELQKLLAGIEDTPEEGLISRLTLRSMQRAKYSANCSGHFGLALPYYCHFTSPIRRYPDLQIHRIMKEYLRGGLDEERMDHYAAILGEVCQSSSARERIAEDAEREAVRLKKAEYMQDHIGEVFDGVISSVTNWGVYVELQNTVEGLIHISKIEGDYFEYNENTYELTGRATGRRFVPGMRIRVICNMVDIEERTVDLIPADDVSALDNDIY